MGGSRTGGQMDILSLQMGKWTAGQGQSQSVWWMENTRTDFSPIPPSRLHSSPNAGWCTTCSHAWQAKASHEQRFVLPPLCNASLQHPWDKITALTQGSAKHRWALLCHCTSVLWEHFPLCSGGWSYLFCLTLNHTNTFYLLPPTVHASFKLLKDGC